MNFQDLFSLQSVLGKIVRLCTRELHKCILSKASCNTPVKVTQEAKGEIQFWRENSRLLNDDGKQVNEVAVYNVRMYCDDSNTGYAEVGSKK